MFTSVTVLTIQRTLKDRLLRAGLSGKITVQTVKMPVLVWTLLQLRSAKTAKSCHTVMADVII